MSNEKTLEDVRPAVYLKFIECGHKVPLGVYMEGWEYNLLLKEQLRNTKDRNKDNNQ